MLANGSYEELQTSGLDFTKFLGSSAAPAEPDGAASPSPADNPKTEAPRSSTTSTSTGTDDTGYVHGEPRKRLAGSVTSVAPSAVADGETEKTEPGVTAETCSTGHVALNVYASYIFSGGRYFKVLALLSVCVVTQMLASGADIWIRVW